MEALWEVECCGSRTNQDEEDNTFVAALMGDIDLISPSLLKNSEVDVKQVITYIEYCIFHGMRNKKDCWEMVSSLESISDILFGECIRSIKEMKGKRSKRELCRIFIR